MEEMGIDYLPSPGIKLGTVLGICNPSRERGRRVPEHSGHET